MRFRYTSLDGTWWKRFPRVCRLGRLLTNSLRHALADAELPCDAIHAHALAAQFVNSPRHVVGRDRPAEALALSSRPVESGPSSLNSVARGAPRARSCLSYAAGGATRSWPERAPLAPALILEGYRDAVSSHQLTLQRSKIQPTIASGATAPMQKQMMVGRKRTSCRGETASDKKGPARMGAGREGRDGGRLLCLDTFVRPARSWSGMTNTCDLRTRRVLQ